MQDMTKSCGATKKRLGGNSCSRELGEAAIDIHRGALWKNKETLHSDR